MTEASVIDASPLIHLCRAGYSSLLQTVAPVAIVPAPVAQEIRAKGPDDPTARVLASTSWLCEVPAQALPPALTSRRLGAGETAVLAWAAAKPNCIAVLDDLRARQLAILLGIRTTGTLGIVPPGQAQRGNPRGTNGDRPPHWTRDVPVTSGR